MIAGESRDLSTSEIDARFNACSARLDALIEQRAAEARAELHKLVVHARRCVGQALRMDRGGFKHG